MSPLRLCTLTGVFFCAAVISLSESLLWQPSGPQPRGRIDASREALWTDGGQPWEEPEAALPANLAAHKARHRAAPAGPELAELERETSERPGVPAHLLLFQPVPSERSGVSSPRP